MPLPEPGPPTTGIKIAPSVLFFLGGIPRVSSYYLRSDETLSIGFIAFIVMTFPVLPYVSITGAVSSLKTLILFLIVY